jgi:hypothetical protein
LRIASPISSVGSCIPVPMRWEAANSRRALHYTTWLACAPRCLYDLNVWPHIKWHVPVPIASHRTQLARLLNTTQLQALLDTFSLSPRQPAWVPTSRPSHSSVHKLSVKAVAELERNRRGDQITSRHAKYTDCRIFQLQHTRIFNI